MDVTSTAANPVQWTRHTTYLAAVLWCPIRCDAQMSEIEWINRFMKWINPGASWLWKPFAGSVLTENGNFLQRMFAATMFTSWSKELDRRNA